MGALDILRNRGENYKEIAYILIPKVFHDKVSVRA